LIFFLSLLPQFVNPAAPLMPQFTLLAVTSIVIEFVILTAYATLADQTSRMANRDRFGTVVERIGGTMLVAAAIGLASASSREV
jgi:homoserine/homoserine lactone efflux protein